MSPVAQTCYSVTLFLALVSLCRWMERRRRMSEMTTRAITEMTRSEDDAYTPGYGQGSDCLRLSSCSARNQSSHGDPPSPPRASQYE